MLYGTCEDEKIGGDAEAAARDPPTPRLRRIKVWDAAAGEEGRRGVSGLERAVRQGKGRQMKRPLHFGKTGQAHFPKMDARRSAPVDTAAVPQ